MAFCVIVVVSWSRVMLGTEKTLHVVCLWLRASLMKESPKQLFGSESNRVALVLLSTPDSSHRLDALLLTRVCHIFPEEPVAKLVVGPVYIVTRRDDHE